MSLSVETIIDLLNTSTYWKVREDGDFEAWNYDRIINDYFLKQTVTAVELAMVHPRLPLTLATQLMWERENTGRPDVRITTTATLLAMLYKQTVLVDDWDGNAHLFKTLSRVEIPFGSKTLVHLHGLELFTETVKIENEAVSILKYTRDVTVVTRRRNLSQRYPGWDQRLSIGADLGIEFGALMAQVFPQETLGKRETVSISDVSFE